MNKLTKRRAWVTIVLFSALLASCSRNPEKAKTRYLASGQNYLKKGQYGDAVIEFRNALRLDPRFVDAYYQLAQADLARHDWGAAYASLQKTIELDPTRLDARLDRGRLYLAARQFEEAAGESNFILKRESNNVAAYQLLGAALVGEQKNQQALSAFEKVTELRSNDPSAYINLALVNISLGHFPDAEQLLRKAVSVDPKSTQGYADLANFYQLEKRVPEAQQILEDGIAKNPEAVLLYTTWAHILVSQGKSGDADGIMDRVRSQMPQSTDAAIAIGDYYLAQHINNKALAEYQRGLSASPHNLEIEKRVEEAYLDSNQPEQAAQSDSQLMRIAPKDVFVRINHGRVLLAQRKPQDAEYALLNLVKDAADSPQAHYYLGLSYWEDGKLGQANSELQEALRLSPSMQTALQKLAELKLAQGSLSEAHAYGQELIQKYPSDVNDRLLLGAIYVRENQARLAEEQFLVGERLAPSHAAAYADLGLLYATQKRWVEAERELDTAIKLEPSNAVFLRAYASFWIAHQQLPKAVASAQQFVGQYPSDPQGHVILGELQLEARNDNAAQGEFERAIQLDPKVLQPYLQMGRIYEREKQTDLAIDQYQKALLLRTDTAPLNTMIGNVYLHRKDFETARQFFKRALAADSDYAVADANLAWADALVGTDLDVALALAQKAKSLMPDLPAVTDTLAWVMYKRGDYTAAAPLFEQCVQKAPNVAEFRYHLGMTLIATGQKLAAKEQLKTALQMKLDDSEAQQAQESLAKFN